MNRLLVGFFLCCVCLLSATSFASSPRIPDNRIPAAGPLEVIKKRIENSEVTPHAAIVSLLESYRDADALAIIKESRLSALNEYDYPMITYAAAYGAYESFSWLRQNDKEIAMDSGWIDIALGFAAGAGAYRIALELFPEASQTARAEALVRAAGNGQCGMFAMMAKQFDTPLSDRQTMSVAESVTRDCALSELRLFVDIWSIEPIIEASVPEVLFIALLNDSGRFRNLFVFWLTQGVLTERFCAAPSWYVDRMREEIQHTPSPEDRQKILDLYLSEC